MTPAFGRVPPIQFELFVKNGHLKGNVPTFDDRRKQWKTGILWTYWTVKRYSCTVPMCWKLNVGGRWVWVPMNSSPPPSKTSWRRPCVVRSTQNLSYLSSQQLDVFPCKKDKSIGKFVRYSQFCDVMIPHFWPQSGRRLQVNQSHIYSTRQKYLTPNMRRRGRARVKNIGLTFRLSLVFNVQ